MIKMAGMSVSVIGLAARIFVRATAEASPKRGSHFTKCPSNALYIPSSPFVIAVWTVLSAFVCAHETYGPKEMAVAQANPTRQAARRGRRTVSHGMA